MDKERCQGHKAKLKPAFWNARSRSPGPCPFSSVPDGHVLRGLPRCLGEPLTKFSLPHIEASTHPGAQRAGKSCLLTHRSHASPSTGLSPRHHPAQIKEAISIILPSGQLHMVLKLFLPERIVPLLSNLRTCYLKAYIPLGLHSLTQFLQRASGCFENRHFVNGKKKNQKPCSLTCDLSRSYARRIPSFTEDLMLTAGFHPALTYASSL